MMSPRKRCSSCRRLKSMDDFHLHARNPDGRQYECIACRRRGYVESAAKRFIARNPRASRGERARGKPRDKKRCIICHRYLSISAFRPSRVAPDGENECSACAHISPWVRGALRHGRRALLEHLAVYDDDLPIAAGL